MIRRHNMISSIGCWGAGKWGVNFSKVWFFRWSAYLSHSRSWREVYPWYCSSCWSSNWGNDRSYNWKVNI